MGAVGIFICFSVDVNPVHPAHEKNGEQMPSFFSFCVWFVSEVRSSEHLSSTQQGVNAVMVTIKSRMKTNNLFTAANLAVEKGFTNFKTEVLVHSLLSTIHQNILKGRCQKDLLVVFIENISG
jgi:hypothetical protein